MLLIRSANPFFWLINVNFCRFRYGPVQSVRVLVGGEGRDGVPTTTVTVAFIDITSALKARQTQHKFDDRYFYLFLYTSISKCNFCGLVGLS